MRQVTTEDVKSQWTLLQPLDGCRERPIALSKPVCVAGDRARVNLTLPAETTSRAHAIFVTDEHGVYLRDLASLNHVFINDQPVREAPLQSGDVLRIGPYAFRCEGGVQPDGAGVASTAPAAELRTPDDSIHVSLNTRRTTVLGSREDCDVKMAGGNVSPAHAVIFELHGRRYIRDLRSISGTFINSRKVGQTELHPDDEIQIGESKLVYAAAPSHDPDGTLAGVLADEEPLPITEEEPLASEPSATPEEESIALSHDESVAIAEEEPAHELVDSHASAAGVQATPPTPQPVPKSSKPATSPSDDSAIPLMEESDDLPSLAREFAEQQHPEPKPQPAAPKPSKSGDSFIIPLLDDSEFAPGLTPEPSAIPDVPAASESAIPLADESSGSAAAQEVAFTKPARPRRRDASEPHSAKRKQKPRSPNDSRSPGRESSPTR